MAESPALRIELLDEFRVTVGAHVVPATAWRRSKAAGLVKLLALSTGHRWHREQTMDALWPELAPAAASANLRKAVHYARRAVDADAGCLAAGVRGWKSSPEFRERMARVLHHVDELHPAELTLIASADHGTATLEKDDAMSVRTEKEGIATFDATPRSSSAT